MRVDGGVLARLAQGRVNGLRWLRVFTNLSHDHLDYTARWRLCRGESRLFDAPGRDRGAHLDDAVGLATRAAARRSRCRTIGYSSRRPLLRQVAWPSSSPPIALPLKRLTFVRAGATLPAR